MGNSHRRKSLRWTSTAGWRETTKSVQISKSQVLYPHVRTLGDPIKQRSFLRSGYFFGDASLNRRACSKAADKETDRGDASTAAFTRPRTPVKCLMMVSGSVQRASSSLDGFMGCVRAFASAFGNGFFRPVPACSPFLWLFADYAGCLLVRKIIGNDLSSVATFAGAGVRENSAEVVAIASGDFCAVTADFFYDWITHGVTASGVGGKTVRPIATVASRRRLSVATSSVSPMQIAAARCSASLVRMKMGGCDAWQRSTSS